MQAYWTAAFELFLENSFSTCTMTSTIKTVAPESVDREKKCPLLLRVFINSSGRHYYPSDYRNGHFPQKEVQIYTWPDASLKELAMLVKEINVDARKPGTRFDFALVFPDPNSPNYRVREIGSTINGRKEDSDLKTLGQTRFQIGDFLDVAITLPGAAGPGGDRNGGGRNSGGGIDRRDSNRGSGGKYNGNERDRNFPRNRGRPY